MSLGRQAPSDCSATREPLPQRLRKAAPLRRSLCLPRARISSMMHTSLRRRRYTTTARDQIAKTILTIRMPVLEVRRKGRGTSRYRKCCTPPWTRYGKCLTRCPVVNCANKERYEFDLAFCLCFAPAPVPSPMLGLKEEQEQRNDLKRPPMNFTHVLSKANDCTGVLPSEVSCSLFCSWHEDAACFPLHFQLTDATLSGSSGLC